MFGRKKIAELREEIRLDNICLDLANGRIDLLLVDIEKLQEELRQANEAMDLLSSQPVIPEPITDVSTDVFTVNPPTFSPTRIRFSTVNPPRCF